MSTYIDYQNLVLSKTPQIYCPITVSGGDSSITLYNGSPGVAQTGTFNRTVITDTPKHGEGYLRWTGTGTSNYRTHNLTDATFGDGYRWKLHVEFWLRQSQANTGSGFVINLNRSGTSSSYRSNVFCSNGTVGFTIQEASTGSTQYQTTTTYPLDGQWHHIVLQWDCLPTANYSSKESAFQRIYVDGVRKRNIDRTAVANLFSLGTSFAPGVQGCPQIEIDEYIVWSYNDVLSRTTELPTQLEIAERYAFALEAIRSKYYHSSGNWLNAVQERYYTQEDPFRYIRWSAFGNTVNAATHFCEIQALTSDGTNRLLNTTPTAIQGTFSLGPLTKLTNGDTNTDDYVDFTSAARAIIQFDMGAVYSDIEAIKFWHYYLDGRSYYDVKIEISTDGTTWKTVYDKALSTTTATGVNTQLNGWAPWDNVSEPKRWTGTQWVNI